MDDGFNFGVVPRFLGVCGPASEEAQALFEVKNRVSSNVALQEAPTFLGAQRIALLCAASHKFWFVTQLSTNVEYAERGGASR